MQVKRYLMFINIPVFMVVAWPMITIAQNSSSISIEVPVLQQLTIIETKNLPDITSSDMEKGYIEIPEAVRLEISSNTDWQLSIRAARENLYVTHDFKPVSDLKWRTRDRGFQPLSMHQEKILSGQAGTRHMLITLDFRLDLNWKNTPPGDIEYAHEFILEPYLH